jgi:hypothetical protein
MSTAVSAGERARTRSRDVHPVNFVGRAHDPAAVSRAHDPAAVSRAHDPAAVSRARAAATDFTR